MNYEWISFSLNLVDILQYADQNLLKRFGDSISSDELDHESLSDDLPSFLHLLTSGWVPYNVKKTSIIEAYMIAFD